MQHKASIIIPDDLDKKIRNFQAKKIKETSQSYSFSSAVIDLLKSSV